MKLHSWFKPTARLTIGEREWVSNGYMALVAPADPALRDIGVSHNLDADVGLATMPVQGSRTNGWAIFGQQVLQGHFVDLVEHAYPGAEWRARQEPKESAPLVAFAGGAPVAIVMPVKGPEPAMACKGPQCTVCEGDGRTRDCPECDGCGDVECSKCGHESECDRCGGKGRVGVCSECKGSGRWSPPAESAA